MSRDRVHLQYILRNIAHIERLTAEGKSTFLDDSDKQAAILYYIQTLSESTTRLDEELRKTQPQIAWEQIRAFRNRVVHDYLSIDLELVWLIATTELTPLKKAIIIMNDLLTQDQDEDLSND